MAGKRLIRGKKNFSIINFVEKFGDYGKKYIGDL